MPAQTGFTDVRHNHFRNALWDSPGWIRGLQQAAREEFPRERLVRRLRTAKTNDDSDGPRMRLSSLAIERSREKECSHLFSSIPHLLVGRASLSSQLSQGKLPWLVLLSVRWQSPLNCRQQ